MIPKDTLKITQGKEHLKSHTQQHILGSLLTVYFCDTCSSNVWKNLHTDQTEELWVIQSGTLDGANGELGADVEAPDHEGFPADRARWLPPCAIMQQSCAVCIALISAGGADWGASGSSRGIPKSREEEKSKDLGYNPVSATPESSVFWRGLAQHDEKPKKPKKPEQPKSTMSFAACRSGPPVERKRASAACQACRARKIRCDVITRLPCIRCRLEGTDCIMTKQKNGNSRRTAAAGRPQQPAASATRVPTPGNNQQFPIDDDVLSALALWPEDNPAPQSHTARLGISPPEGASLQTSFLQGSVDQTGCARLFASDLLSPLHIQQLPAANTPSFDWLDGSTSLGSPSIGSCKLSHLSDEDLNYLIRKEVFALPPQPVQESLFRAYFLFVHPFLPVLAEDEAWSEYEHGFRNMSLLLHKSMLFAACPFISSDDIRQLGYSSIAEAQESLFEKARLLFDFETEEDKFAIIGAALLLSYRSPRPFQKSFQRTSYWLTIATSIIKEMSHSRERPCTGTMDRGKSLKRLQWACAVRELTISLSSRKIADMEPCLPNLPPLHVEDITDSTLYSKVYDKETKLTLTRMFLSLTELTKLVVKIRLVKPSEGSDPDLCSCAITLNQLRQAHFCNSAQWSPIAINYGIIHMLQRPLYQFTQSSDRQESVKLCINVLEELQQRFPVVNDMMTILYATIQFAEQEVATYSLWKPLSADFGDGKDLLSGHDQEMIVQEADIISRTIHFLDMSFYKGEPVLSLNDLTRQAFPQERESSKRPHAEI
ncbi:hypothetical protein G7Z17_g593 [Cylindrodendrum hubeiense]|uniref:Zn(2)-C6 fungal-type domain-containing protein n=1 Tax=Cylindrodendrum hubeiense TaxID=595255 RepID=A0A9P5LMZ3_9HYPO|nr:hypothetical protein G7Z17_g593 [Cylindrodendrum hubeiense]